MSTINVTAPKAASVIGTTRTTLTDTDDVQREETGDAVQDDGDATETTRKCCGWWQFQGVPKAKGFSYVRPE